MPFNLSTNSERGPRNQQALRSEGLAAVVCALPANVLLFSGYWPVVGSSIAICVCGEPTMLLIPEDEAELAGASFADSVEMFAPETVTEMTTISQAVKPRLTDILRSLNIDSGRIGFESGACSQPASYLSQHLYGDDLRFMLREALPAATLTPIADWIEALWSVKTSGELARIRQACEIAKRAFERSMPLLSAGMTEREASQYVRSHLTDGDVAGMPILRNDGFAFCMSGPNSAKAYAAYARTRQRKLENSDLVMIHCNSYVDGFWTDITRTYTLRTPDKEQETMYSAVFAARAAALSAIRHGVRAAVIDGAVRHTLQDYGFGQSIKHGTGHGVGLSAMSAYSIPRVHACFPDILQEGMVFNVEPAIYREGYGGVRHCDMVAVTGDGCELLTNFQSDMKSLIVPARDSDKRSDRSGDCVARSSAS